MCKCSGKCGCNITSTTKGTKGDSGSVSNFGYKVYKASLTQIGTDAPYTEDGMGNASSPFVNTIGTISFTRGGVGEYTIDSSSLFTIGKTWFSIDSTSISGVANSIILSQGSSSSLSLQTFASGVPSDDVLNVNRISIEVYP